MKRLHRQPFHRNSLRRTCAGGKLKGWSDFGPSGTRREQTYGLQRSLVRRWEIHEQSHWNIISRRRRTCHRDGRTDSDQY